MTLAGKAHHHSHSCILPFALSARGQQTTTVPFRTHAILRGQVFRSTAACTVPKQRSVFLPSEFSLLRMRRGFAWGQYRRGRVRNEMKSAVRFRQGRTELSGRSSRSRARGSVSAISRALPGQLKPRPIYLTLPATTGAPAAAGWPVTPSRRPLPLASFSPRS